MTAVRHLRLLVTLALPWATGCGADPANVRLASPRVGEASGLAVSPTRPDRLWLLNDSGNLPELQLAGTDGSDRGTLRIEGVRNLDWEDLAAFRWKGRSWLLVGDIGDNAGVRRGVTLHLVAEPELPGDGQLDAAARPEWSLEFRYPDGPRDCECLGVDVAEGSILLLSKRDRPPRLYRLPLEKPKKGAALASFVGQAASPPLPPGTLPHPFGHQPTAMDLSADGRRAVLLTYRGAFRVERRDKESWAEAFARPPELIAAHRLAQAESIAIHADRVYVTSEGPRPPLIEYRIESASKPPASAR